MNKKILYYSLIVLFFSGCKTAHNHRLSPVTNNDELLQAKAFMEFIHSLKNLELNPKKLSRKEQKTVGLIKKYEFDYGNFKIFSFGNGVGENRNKIGGGSYVLLKSGKPFLSAGRFGIHDQKANRCDSAFLKKMVAAGIRFDFLEKDCCYPCFFTFENLEEGERKFIHSLVGDSLVNSVVEWYIFVAPFYEIRDPQFDFYNTERSTQFGISIPGPHLEAFKYLYRGKKHEVLKKLLYTQNIIFNWFVAEALFFYNHQDNFLDANTLEKVESFNGKNGFTKFRKVETLQQLYGN